ncbi:MAG: FtsX-like permease family protein, partial [Candidatus Pacebacteria bacterium]|nr:FtsX-like permease family protein [Candidatus Paceibacterota bacterium]
MTAFIRAEDVEVLNLPISLTRGKVLGESITAGNENLLASTTSSSTNLNASSSAVVNQIDTNGEASIESLLAEFSEDEDLDLVEIISQLESVNRIEKIIMPFQNSAKKIVLVNRSMLNLLGIDENSALGESFNATLVFDGKLFNQSESLVESDEVMMTIAGILPDDKTPAFYLPFGDVKGTGISNYSQAKVIIGDQDKIIQSRQEIETMGFRTNSVLDTVERINNLFNSLRLGLLVFGLVALSVAALGMFNTLTVSLLEKTREVGLMKAIGMKSQEVKMLFLAESVIMGFLGGVLGLIFGFLAGQILNLVLTSIAVASGFDPIVATHIPFNLALLITASSFVIGVATGFYPANRATRISALNALRYE